VAWIERREIDVTLPFECPCGHSAMVVARGRGIVSGMFPTEGLSRSAQFAATLNAQMRCELTPCPSCGKRRFTMFWKNLRNTTFFMIAFVLVCAAIQWMSDTREFEHELETSIIVYACLLGAMLACLGIAYLLELRSARGKVRFSAQ
jgi:uncharacterized membrane protein